MEEEIIAKGYSIPTELDEVFENALRNLQELNKLKNKLEHAKGTKDVQELGELFRKLINKPIPRSEEDYQKVQEILPEKTTVSMENLSRVLQEMLQNSNRFM